MAAGAHLPGTAIGGGRALFRRGWCAGLRHAGSGKTAGAAGEPTPDTHYPGAAFLWLPESLDARPTGPCSGG